MLESLSIKNFRCFEHLDVQGFKRVNLIGGKNNAGKTALLEAILLYFYPIPRAIQVLKQSRRESFGFSRSLSRFAWGSFFYNQNTEQKIRILGYQDKKSKKTYISIPSSLEDLLLNKRDFFEIMSSKEGLAFSVLQIQSLIEEKEKEREYVMVTSLDGIFYSVSLDKDLPLIPSSFLMDGEEIAQQYDLISFQNRSHEVLRILNILDPSIEKAETFSIHHPTLYLTRHQQRLPISSFGDAINRSIAIALRLLNQEHDVLLIDEIENGIHYSSQQEFWDALFKLANELDTMIFATTHSLEMIKAFARAGHDYPGDGAYFELARSPRDNQIVAINRDIETLDYALERGKPIRGE